jgi:AMMECR1 domain-containing protein
MGEVEGIAMQEKLTIAEQKTLLRLAREAMEHGVKGEDVPPVDETLLTPSLREEGSSFITLTEHGQLRGCIGSLEPYQSLAADVREHVEYKDVDDLLSKLRPHVDGVILRDGSHRATFLPQVWEKIPRPTDFLDNLCYKMGVNPDLWRRKHMEVLTYKVEEFHE